jgi:hypothetical protein
LWKTASPSGKAELRRSFLSGTGARNNLAKAFLRRQDDAQGKLMAGKH